MASVVSRNGKYAVVYYEGEDRTPVWKSGLTYTQAEKLKERKTKEEKKWRDQNKKERQKVKTTGARIALGNAGENHTDATIEEFMEDFIMKYGTKNWGDSYFSSNVALMNNYVYPHLGQNSLVDVNSQMIDDYYDFLLLKCKPVLDRGNSKRKHVSPSLVRDIHKVLRTGFNQAKRWKLIRQNPFLDADVPEHKSKERPAFAPGEFEKILEYSDDATDYDRYTIHVALCIQYYCTTRGGEVGGLQWSDYSLKERTLHIYKAVDRVAKENLDLPKLIIYYKFPIMNPCNKSLVVLKAPKTEATERFGKLNNLMIEKLNHLKEMQEELVNTVFGESYQDNRLIICQQNGRPIMPEQLNRKFKALIAEMRENGYKFESVPENLLDEVVFHSVRAASATKKMQVSNGNIKAVMKAGGWAEPDMVIRYSKTYDNDQADMVNQMEADYLTTTGNAKPPVDTEELLRIIQDNPELLHKLLATAK